VLAPKYYDWTVYAWPDQMLSLCRGEQAFCGKGNVGLGPTLWVEHEVAHSVAAHSGRAPGLWQSKTGPSSMQKVCPIPLHTSQRRVSSSYASSWSGPLTGPRHGDRFDIASWDDQYWSLRSNEHYASSAASQRRKQNATMHRHQHPLGAMCHAMCTCSYRMQRTMPNSAQNLEVLSSLNKLVQAILFPWK
jgi:hypothetical protein